MIRTFLTFSTLGGVLCSSPLFVAFADWGDDTATFAQTVAQLKAQPRARFVALLGDNFYPSGVSSVDDPQFGLFDRFSSVSDRFLVALGNHDHILPNSVDSQIAYSKKNPKWILPSRYYMERMDLNSGMSLCAIVLDTHVFDSTQRTWLEQQLIACQSTNTFRIILTHYPMMSVGVYASSGTVASLRTQILPLIYKYKVHAYLSGHEHQMQVLESQGVHFIVSGATAQTNRNNGFVANMWTSELRYVNDNDVGFVSFAQSASDPTVLNYKFVNANGGGSLYASSIRLSGAVVTTAHPPATTSTHASTTTMTTTSHQTTTTRPTSTTGHQTTTTTMTSHPTTSTRPTTHPSTTTTHQSSTTSQQVTSAANHSAGTSHAPSTTVQRLKRKKSHHH